MTQIPLSLYVHFPWCVRKCPYCDFNSHALVGTVPEDDYVAALLRDLDHELAEAPEPRPLTSLFFGGGTPSLFTGAAIARVLEGVRQRLPLAPDAEITLEANPGSADVANFRAYRAAGVNRLSLGIQSFDDARLAALGRVHGAAEARAAMGFAREAGFDNVNLDLMYALPRQTPAEAAADLEQAIALAPEHLSYYHLTLEPNTAFHAQPPPLPDADTAWSMQEEGQAKLAAAGYAQYEVSAYAQPGRACRHNLNYWEFGDYLGIGAGAHGKRTRVTDAGCEIVRRARHRHPRIYLQQAGSAAAIQEEHRIPAGDLPFEFAMNALRLGAGFRFADFEQRTGQPSSVLDAPLRDAERKGLIERDAMGVRPSARGRTFLNRLTALFLPARPAAARQA